MNKINLTCKDVCELLSVSECKAYEYIRKLNAELEEKGFLTVRGKVPAKYLLERFYSSVEPLEGVGAYEPQKKAEI